MATFTPDGDLHIPEEAMALLELDGVKEVAIISDATGIHLIPLKKTLHEIRASAKSDRVFSEDFDIEIEEAMDEALREKYR
jgi:hypothetical protein